MPKELLHLRTRSSFREAFTHFSVIAQIRRMFEDEGIQPFFNDFEPRPTDRRGTVDEYYAAVDWSSHTETRLVLNVFERGLAELDIPDDERTRLIGHLKRDGFALTRQGHIVAAAALPEFSLASLDDATAIREHLDRLAASVESDPSLAIGSAKELIESTVKVVLGQLGQEYDERAGVPSLAKQAQRALSIHQAGLSPDARGADTIKRILSSLSQIAVGVSELRNLYGTGHGRTLSTGGLGRRHARLAVGSAHVYCQMLLDTLEEVLDLRGEK